MEILKVKIDSLYKVIKSYIDDSDFLDKKYKEQIHNMTMKMTDNAKKSILMNPNFVIYVNDVLSFLQRNNFSNIIDFSNRLYVYMYYKLLVEALEKEVKYKGKLLANEKVTLLIKQKKRDNKFEYELNKIIEGTLSVIEYSKNKNSLCLDLSIIDKQYSSKPTEIAKASKRSISATLLNRKVEHTFRRHPDCKNKIVNIEELTTPYLHLNNRQLSTKCPICEKKIIITNENIDSIIGIHNSNVIIYKCTHTGTVHIKKQSFSVDLTEYFKENNYRPMDKKMFFLNNMSHFI